MLDDERGQEFAVLAVGGAALLLLGVSVRDGRPRRGRAPSGSRPLPSELGVTVEAQGLGNE